MIPPPIVQSTYTASKPSPSRSPNRVQPVAANNDLLLFRRKQKQLEADLQILLDAQAEGLLSGLNTNSEDDAASTGSSTPTALSSNLRNVRSGTPSIQKHIKIGLREARRGLHSTMRKLAVLKAEEFEYLAPELEECEAVVSQLEEWERKKERLEERTRQIHQGEEHKRAKDLKQKADDMQTEINELEARLGQLKTQQRKLRREALDCENEVQARLTSYTASLDMLEQHSRDFLNDMQRNRPDTVSTARHSPEASPSTLRAARQSYSAERKQLRARQGRAEKDQEALEEGAAVWKDVVREVSDFERRLQEDMARLSSAKSKSNPREAQESTRGNESAVRTATDMEQLLALLDQTTTQLESKHKLAETRNWKLLVAAIGAELEAFLKGKQILEAAMAASAATTDPPLVDQGVTGDMGSQSIYDDFRTPRSSVIRHVDDGEAIRDLDQAFGAKKNGTVVLSDTDTEDDGPDPELLISHHQSTEDEDDGPDPELLISHQQDTDTDES